MKYMILIQNDDKISFLLAEQPTTLTRCLERLVSIKEHNPFRKVFLVVVLDETAGEVAS